MSRCLLIALLAFGLSHCISGQNVPSLNPPQPVPMEAHRKDASPLQGPPIPASVNAARDTEKDELTSAPSNTERPTAELGPEVPDMLSGVTVNQTFLHKVDSDNDEPGIVVAPIPELSTHRSLPPPDHETNLTDKVNSPRVLDPGTTHQEDSSNKTSVNSKVDNTTKEESANVSQPAVKPVADVVTAAPEKQSKPTNNTAVTPPITSQSNKTEDATAPPAMKKPEEHVGETPVVNNTKVTSDNVTQPPPPPQQTGRPAEAVAPTTKAPAPQAKNETKPQPPPSGQVEVFAPSVLNETQNLLAGYEPQTSEQHADHLQLSGTADPSFLQPSQSAAILAGVFVVVALLGYVGLLVWRRLLERKYGNREMLVNEDEFYDTSDLRHFEL